MIKNIIFDIGGVLADPKSGNWFITNNFFNIVDEKQIDNEKLIKSLKENMFLQTQNPKDENQEHEMFSKYYYKVLQDINYPNLTLDISNEIANDCVYNDEKFIFYDDVELVLKDLAKKYNLYIISNGWPSSLRVLKSKKLDKYFKDIFISSMYGTIKEEKLFDTFLNKNNLDTTESLYIDDRSHILDKASEYEFNLLLMNRKNKTINSKYQIINNLNSIYEVLK